MDYFTVIAIAEALEEDKYKKEYWVHPLNSTRLQDGQFQRYAKYRAYPVHFFKYFRMTIQSFDELLFLISNNILKKDTTFRDSISPAERLMITIRYLSTGMTFQSLSEDFLTGRSTIARIVKETCVVIWKILQPIEMPEPTEEMWLDIAETFFSTTNFPNCIGALDGKHVRIVCPALSGSRFFNYKKFSSVVLLALADANLNFIMIDVGAYGREGDSAIFKRSILGIRLRRETLNLPVNRELPNTNEPRLPFVIVGDEAFALDKHLMRPFPGNNLNREKRTFNYRLSRARRCVECTFSVLCNKWRILHTPILTSPDYATHIVKAVCVLHNFIRKRDGYNFKDQFFGHNLESISSESSHQIITNATTARQKFMEYFKRAERGEINTTGGHAGRGRGHACLPLLPAPDLRRQSNRTSVAYNVCST